MSRFFERTEVRLAVYNITVFALVLLVFCFVVYGAVVDGLDADIRADLKRLADATISSIDFDDEPEPGEKVKGPSPELITNVLPGHSSQSLDSISLQWFDASGKLAGEKGSFSVTEPLNKIDGFEKQKYPRGLLYTEAAKLNGKVIGYVRVAEPMEESLRTVKHFLFALLAGVLAASCISLIGIVFLIRKAMQPLYASIEQLKRFTSHASHELRTPVTVIMSNSSVALRNDEGMRSSDREKLQLILQTSKQMATLVDELLQLEKLQARHPESEAAVTDLSELMHELESVALDLNASNRLKLNFVIEDKLIARGTRDELRSVIWNLVENAMRYTPDGGLVSIGLSRTGPNVTVTVKDSGFGITAGAEEKIFDRFWRGENAREKFPGGTGLGLSIVKETVQQLNGSVRAQNRADGGALFTVTLPAATKTQSALP